MKKYSREVVMGFGVLWDPKAEAERRVAEGGVDAQPETSRDRNGLSVSLRQSQLPNTSSISGRSDGPGPQAGPIARKVYKFETVHTCSPGPLAVPPEPDATADTPLGTVEPNGVLPPNEDPSPVKVDPDSGSRRRHRSKGKRSSPKEEADERAKRPRKAAVAMAHTAAPPPPLGSSVGLAKEFTGTKTCIPETTGTHTVPWLALDTAADGSASNDNNGDSNNREVSPPPILPIPQIPGMEHMEEVMDEKK